MKPKKNNKKTIQDFFQAADNKSVYVEALKEKLKSYDGDTDDICSTNENNASEVNSATELVTATPANGNNSTCVDCGELRKQLNEINMKCEQLKKSHAILSIRHTDTLMKYDELLNTATNTVRSNTGEASAVLTEDVPSDGIFDENEIRYLQSIPLDKKKDSTFILQCLQYAYKDNANGLSKKTLKGVPEKKLFKDDGKIEIQTAKEKLTPEKVKKIKELFIERVSNSKVLAGEFGERIKATNINKLIAAGVKNIANKQKPIENLTNENNDLSL